VDQAVYTEEECVFHAASTLGTLVCLRVACHVEKQLLLGTEAALADCTLELISHDLHQSRLHIHRGRLNTRAELGLAVAHVVDADVPAELLDRCANLRTLSALERRHVVGLVEQLWVQVQPAVSRVLKRRLLVTMHDAFMALEARDVAEAFATVITRLSWWDDTVLLSQQLETLWYRYSTTHASRVTAPRPASSTYIHQTIFTTQHIITSVLLAG